MGSVPDNYFRPMRIQLRRGRFFSSTDAPRALPVIRWYDQQPYPEHYNEPQSIPTVIINETMARLYWANENPLGHRIRIIASPWLTIVGVVGDIHHAGLAAKPNPEMYLSQLQEPSNSLAVMVRTTGDPLQLAAPVGEEVTALDTANHCQLESLS